ncbi:phosphotransferase family protein [Cellulomonas sp. P5_E12]
MPYLVQAGLLAEDVITDGGLVVDAVARRHQNLRVTLPAGAGRAGFFVKQADALAVGGLETVAAEGRFYAGTVARAPALAPVVPSLLRYDDHQGVVVLELLADFRTLRELVATEGPERFPTRVWRRIGEILAVVHGRPGERPRLPWVLDSVDPAVEALAVLGPAALRAFQIVQGSRIRVGLLAAADRWEPTCFTHGDLRTDNVLVGPRGSEPTGPTREDVRLVDWEFSGHGDPRWDIAGALADAVVSSWDRFGTELSLPVVQACGLAVRRGYGVATQGVSDPEWPGTVACFAAAHLVVATLSEARVAGHDLTHRGVGYLQVAENILADPAGAAADLFGVTDPG